MDGHKRLNPTHLWRVFSVTLCVAVAVGTLHAEENTVGAALLRTVWRSDYVGATLSPNRTYPADSLGTLFLPQAAAATNEPTLHASGGTRSDGRGAGGAVAGTYPGLYAAWTGATGVYRDDDGLLWRGDAGAARPVGRRSVAGASVTTQFSQGEETSDFGIGINLGSSIRLGGSGAFSGVTLHGGVLNIGK